MAGHLPGARPYVFHQPFRDAIQDSTSSERRGSPADWQSLAWLRGTEIATDALWASSPAVSRPGAKLGLRLAGVANIAMAAGFAWMARR